jgi:hypothetical protein
MNRYQLIEYDNADGRGFPLCNKFYKSISLTEKDRYKTTDVLEEIIGDLQNFIITSVLLQNNHGTFKSKDNKQKKEFLCRILNIDHFSESEKDILDHYKKLKSQLTLLNRNLNSASDTSVDKINDVILDITNNQIPKTEEDIKSNENLINETETEILNMQSNLIKLLDFDNHIQNELDLSETEIKIQTMKKSINSLIESNYELNSQIQQLVIEINQLDLPKDKSKITNLYNEFINQTDLNIKTICTNKSINSISP